MSDKGLTKMKQRRDKFLLEFKAAGRDLEEETSGEKAPNERRIKVKIRLVKSTYDECLDAHAQVIGAEKTSGAEESNWTWVDNNLRKPRNLVLEKAEELLESMQANEDPEAEEKAKIAEEIRDTRIELTCFEATLKDRTQGAKEAYEDTTIWLQDNHSALTEEVKALSDDLTKVHMRMCKTYLKYFGDTDSEAEVSRQGKFREEISPVLTKLQASLLSKTPARSAQPAQVVQPGHVKQAQGGPPQQVAQQSRTKFKMAAMAIPKFSGRVIDYPEWKTLFRDCVESQYEESAVVMLLRTQSLPDSLTNLVPRCSPLATVWDKLDKKFLDPSRVWKGVKADLATLDRKKLGDRKYMVALVGKILDAENLLESVGMVHWLRQEDKIPEYEDLMSRSERLEWVRSKPTMTGTPWENLKKFMIRMRDEYEEIAKTGTTEFEEEKEKEKDKDKGKKCTFCKRSNHTEEDCWMKKSGSRKGEDKKECFLCGSDEHLARNCSQKFSHGKNKVSKIKNKKDDSTDQDNFSNFLRVKDCRWCGRVYNSVFSCSGCGKQWGAKSKVEHCLAHCVAYTSASVKERGEMAIKGGNCLICLHHEHVTDSCFGKDQQRTICGLDNCMKRHHPSLHSAPQGSIQAVKTAGHLLVEEGSVGTAQDGDINPGVGVDEVRRRCPVATGIKRIESFPVATPSDQGEMLVLAKNLATALSTSILGKTGPQGKFLASVRSNRVQTQRVSWTDSCWIGGTAVRMEEQRAKELEEMKELLKLPPVEGNNVLLLIQSIKVKYGPGGDSTEFIVFWDNGSTCSLVQTEIAERLGCPGEPVTVSIETVNGVITRDTKIYCVELLNHGGERVVIKAFGVERISDVKSVVEISAIKEMFSQEVQTQWGKISRRPQGTVHLLVGDECAGYHPVQYEARNNLVVCRTMFGQGWMITGSDPGLQAEEHSWGEEVAALRVGRITVVNQANHRISVSTNPVKLTFTQDRDFYTLENLGIEPARRCPGCKECKECSWRGQSISRQEAFELEYIEKCVELKDHKFQIKFPFLVDPAELADNYAQVVGIAESEERRLERDGKMQEFNELFEKLQVLGAMEEISDHELKSWSGPVHYVSLQHVIDEGNATTSLRIVSNSSLRTPGNPHSLNSILAKGPNLLSDPYKIMIRFRTYLKGLSSDVTKAYYQMSTGMLEKHVRRVVWRYGVKGTRWRIFGYLCVSFGDTPAAALLEVCLRLVIVMYGYIDQLAADRLSRDHFVDDITSGGDPEQVRRFKGEENPETLECNGTMPQIFNEARLKLKAIAVSGEADGGALQKLSGAVLGHGYSTARDTLSVKFRVNISHRRRGNPTGPDITKDTLDQLNQTVLTRRLALGIANGQYDLLGMVTPVLIKLKASMRDLFVDKYELGWDTPLPGELNEVWIGYIRELVEAEEFEFQRCVRPEGKVKDFWLVVFFDGSDQAFAGVVYCRWEMENGEVVVTLLCSKARTVPLHRLSTPRSELNGAVIAVRLAWTVVQALEFEEKPSKVLFGGDSETVLGAREKGCGALGEYFGNRIGECWDLQNKIAEIVPVGIAEQGEWYHLPSNDNAADMPSRIDSMVEDLVVGSEWKHGKSYMLQPFCDWPWERKFADRKLADLVPRDEVAAKYRGGRLVAGIAGSIQPRDQYCYLAAGTMSRKEVMENPIVKKFDEGYITNDYDELISKTEPVFRYLARLRAKKDPSKLTLTSRELAVRFWFQVSMPATEVAMKAGKLKELTIQVEQGMYVIKGRAVAGMKQMLGTEFLPVLMSSERISVLVMLKSHVESSHKSVDITFSTSRHYCWIVGGRKLAKMICKFCVRCRYLKKIKETQKMATLPEELGVPCPAFTNVGVDLAGPYQVYSMVKKRGTRRGSGTVKVWAVLVMCLNTRALKIYMAPGYSTGDFMVAWEEFEADCGVPRKVHSDRGSQLISAAGNIDVPEYDWELISSSSKGQTSWTFCPSGSQWRNGAVESFVKRFKMSLELYQHSGLSYAELQTAFKKIASVLNSRPVSARYGPRHADSDPDYLEMITPNMLLTSRSGVDLPMREYIDEKSPARRLAYKAELERAWWQQWKVQCFDSLLPTKAWTQEKRGVKTGDVVLISYEDKSKTGTFKLGIVEQVEVDSDGLVRTCVVAYRLVRSDLPMEEMRLYYKGLKCKKLRVPVQRLCIILPVEEHDEPDFQKRKQREEMMKTVKTNIEQVDEVKVTIEKSDACQYNVGEELLEDFDEIRLNDAKQVAARNFLIKSFRVNNVQGMKGQVTSNSARCLHGDYSVFEMVWQDCQGGEDNCPVAKGIQRNKRCPVATPSDQGGENN